MRIGAPHYLLFSRYADLWRNLLAGIDVEWLELEPQQLQHALDSSPLLKGLEQVAGVNFQLAMLELQLFQEVDALLIPELNPQHESRKGSGQNPWIASLADMVQLQFPRLPKLLRVPAQQALAREYLEPLVTRQLMSMIGNAALVRRSWERQRLQASKKVVLEAVLWQAADKKTVVLLAQPWLLNDLPLDWQKLLQNHYPAENYHILQQNHFDPTQLRQEGWGLEPKLLASDAEVLGAARWLGRKPEVTQLIFLSDETQPSDAWLARKLEAMNPRKYSSYSLQQLTQSKGVDTLRYIVEATCSPLS